MSDPGAARPDSGPDLEAARPGPEAARLGRLRVVIAEDSVLLLAGLTKLLDGAGFEVCATAGDADSLLAGVERERPDVVIADVRMPPSHTDEGIRAALVIRRQWPDIAILVLSQYVEERYAAELLSANTRGLGYLLKDRVADVAEFLDALRRVAAGGTALDPEVVAQLLVRTGGNPLDGLTQRERDVLALMAEGRANTEIGAALVITEGAVSKHINSIFAKLQLYPGDVGHRRVLAVLRYLGVEPGLSGPFDGGSPDISRGLNRCVTIASLRPPVVPELGGRPGRRPPRRAGHLDERRLLRPGQHLPELRRPAGRLVRGLRDERRVSGRARVTTWPPGSAP